MTDRNRQTQPTTEHQHLPLPTRGDFVFTEDNNGIPEIDRNNREDGAQETLLLHQGGRDEKGVSRLRAGVPRPFNYEGFSEGILPAQAGGRGSQNSTSNGRTSGIATCKVCNEQHLGCETWGCWKDAGAAGMVRSAIAKERKPVKKLNVVNLILGSALIVAVVAAVLGVVYGY